MEEEGSAAGGRGSARILINTDGMREGLVALKEGLRPCQVPVQRGKGSGERDLDRDTAGRVEEERDKWKMRLVDNEREK